MLPPVYKQLYTAKQGFYMLLNQFSHFTKIEQPFCFDRLQSKWTLKTLNERY